jgi:Na+/H+ antiporter NhaB
MSEYDALRGLLEQQNLFITQRFDRLEERARHMERQLAEVIVQTTKTNGTVTRPTEQIATLFKGDPGKEPLLTMSQGALLKKAVTYAVSVGTALYFAVRWLWANAASLIPGLAGVVR